MLKRSSETPTAILNSFIDNSLTHQERLEVEKALEADALLRESYQQKMLDKQFILNSLPEVSLSKKQQEVIATEIAFILKTTIKAKKPSLVKKVWKFLDTPFI